MGTEHDSTALLRGDDVEDVVDSRGYGLFRVEILEGPTDNPLRLLGPGGVRPAYQEFYTFGIEGVGWNLLQDIMHHENKSEIPYHLSCFMSLVRNFPGFGFGLLDSGKRYS